MSIAASLAASLPRPKYTGEDEDVPVHAQQRGPRIVGAGVLDDSQIVLRRTGPPPYGQRSGWRPRSVEDFGDGGAFPEIAVAQYPLEMGRKSAKTSNALAIQVDGEGKVKYDAIAKQGHHSGRIVQASFKDLIPLRHQANAGEISLARPSPEEVEAAKKKTQEALAKLVSGAVAAQKPKTLNLKRDEATYVRYTPANQMGDNTRKNDRIMKIVERQRDPMEPPKFKHKKIPRGPPSPPAPVMHSPPRKLTAEDQEAWRIPPPISNWKNPKGYTVPLDKRLAADGRGLQDVTINDKFAQLSEALGAADRHAREEVNQRAQMQQRVAEKEKLKKEEHLRKLAEEARNAQSRSTRNNNNRSNSKDRSRPRSCGSRSPSYSSRSSSSSSEDNSGAREREQMRRERRQEAERQLRQSRMGAERRVQMMAREQNRDISEKVALGLAKPTQSNETMYDSRLFNQTSGFNTGFNEDQPYDKPLFAAQEAISSIYRPRANVDDDDDEEAGGGSKAELERISKSNRFDVLGKAKEGFRGADIAEERDGPVVFEKAEADPFGIEGMIDEVTGGKGKKRFGLEEGGSGGRGGERERKRARVEDEDDD
ncbi:MAG: mRNA splicing protein [Cirrosporium novae-zelandiae]|nr:MAG: mRNA splicing protein [Cirrosporium novae-zelandiae]